MHISSFHINICTRKIRWGGKKTQCSVFGPFEIHLITSCCIKWTSGIKWTTCRMFIQNINRIQLTRNREYKSVERILQRYYIRHPLKDAVSSMESKHCIGPCQDDLCFKMYSHIKLYSKVKINHLSLPTPSTLNCTYQCVKGRSLLLLTLNAINCIEK